MSSSAKGRRQLYAVWVSLIMLAVSAWIALGDVTPPWINKPIVITDSGATDQAARARWVAARDSSLLVAVTVSGGGARAAAFGYGVLRELQDTAFDWNGRQTNLLDATDVIGGVSGGSIVAAYYAAFGTEGLTGFEHEFLYRDFQNSLLIQGLKPANLRRLTAQRFGRSHLLEQRLDTLFHGITFGEVMQRHRHPQLLISATDLAQGAGFEFTSDQFKLLCSDFASVPLSFAVAASSSVPLLLSPMTLRNYSQKCREQGIAQHLPSSQGSGFRARLYELQQRSYLDGAARPYVHLVDGGVADNLGIRRLLDRALAGANLGEGFEEIRIDPGSVHRLVLITVNAERDPNERLDKHIDTPGPLQVLDALRFGSGSRATHETQEFLTDLATQWRKDLQRSGRHDIFASNARIHVVQVNLRDTPVNADAQAHLLRIPTALSVPADEVTRLIAAGRAVLRHSTEFQALRTDLRASPTPAVR